MTSSLIPTDQELRIRLRNSEDHFVERKTLGDSKDWLAQNGSSVCKLCAVGFPCVLFHEREERRNGEPLPSNTSLEKLQNSFAEKVRVAYPPIPNFPPIVEVNGVQVLAVIIPGSESRPHFSGLAYVRRGEKTGEASEEQHRELLARTNSKAAAILEWKGKQTSSVRR